MSWPFRVVPNQCSLDAGLKLSGLVTYQSWPISPSHTPHAIRKYTTTTAKAAMPTRSRRSFASPLPHSDVDVPKLGSEPFSVDCLDRKSPGESGAEPSPAGKFGTEPFSVDCPDRKPSAESR